VERANDDLTHWTARRLWDDDLAGLHGGCTGDLVGARQRADGDLVELHGGCRHGRLHCPRSVGDGDLASGLRTLRSRGRPRFG